jgi:hypothetical protein
VGRAAEAVAPPLLAPEPAAAAPSLRAACPNAETQESPAWKPAPALPFCPPVAPPRDTPDATLELRALLPATELPFSTTKP